MPNAVEIKCNSCKKKYLISADELMYFGNGECRDCMDPFTRHIRNFAVMGYYELPEIEEQITDALLKKLFERRKYPRINLKEI